MTPYATTEWNNKVVLHDAFWDLDDESKLAVLKHEEVHRKQPLWKRIFKNKECELEAYFVEKMYLRGKIHRLQFELSNVDSWENHTNYMPNLYKSKEHAINSEKNIIKTKIANLSKMLANAESEIERLRE